jgi:RNA polymerase sigma factor (sigma-70 family)
LDSRSIIEGLRDHDKEVIGYIFSMYFPMIENLVKTNGNGSRQDAEDLFMNAMEALYLKAGDEHFTLSSAFSTLLFEICKRNWLKVLKQKKRSARVTFDTQSELIAVEDFLPALERSERYQLYREKFGKLSKGCQEVLQLTFEGFSMKEIAERLGFAGEGYARKRKFKCKEKLMQLVRSDARYQELTNYDRERKD